MTFCLQTKSFVQTWFGFCNRFVQTGCMDCWCGDKIHPARDYLEGPGGVLVRDMEFGTYGCGVMPWWLLVSCVPLGIFYAAGTGVRVRVGG